MLYDRLDHLSKNVLKFVNANAADKNIDCSVIANALHRPIEEITQCCGFLVKMDYLEAYRADDTFYYITATYTGKKYTEFSWINFKVFITHSIFTPIFVAVITALITTALTMQL